MFNGPSKKCSLLINIGTDRLRSLQKTVPTYIQETDDYKAYSVCSFANRFVFVSGGDHQGCQGTKVFRIDLSTDTWEEMNHMNEARAGHSSCTLGGFLYVCGVGGF